MKIRLSLLFATATLSFTSPTKAALITYTFAGTGPISGILAGTPFTATSFSISATADSGTIQAGTFSSSDYPMIFNAVAPTIILDTPDGLLSASLLPRPNLTLSVFSADTRPDYDPFENVFGLDYIPTDGHLQSGLLFHDSGPSDLASAALYDGTIFTEATFFSTDVGDLYLYTDASPDATFTIAPVSTVPEPSTAGAAILLALAGTCIASRRSRS